MSVRNMYRSGFEGMVAEDLRNRGIPFDYETEELEYVSTVRGGCCTECGSKKVGKRRKYTPDFVLKDGTLFVETKGRFPSTDRSKMRDVKKAHPDKDIRLLFQRTSKAEMAKLQVWADKFGFVCAFGASIPEEWL